MPWGDPEYLAPLIREHHPDLVVLQEVTTGYAAAFDRAFGDEYPYSFVAGSETEHEGAGTWSRLPLVESEAFRLSDWGNQLHRVRVSTGQGDLWLYNVHLPNPTDPNNIDDDRGRLAAIRDYDESRRDAELHALATRLLGLDAPFVIAGDFNLAAGSRAYRTLPSGWQDAFGEAGQGFGHTYPAPDHDHEGEEFHWRQNWLPLIRIDYVFASRELTPMYAWTDVVSESDHLALLVDLALPQAR